MLTVLALCEATALAELVCCVESELRPSGSCGVAAITCAVSCGEKKVSTDWVNENVG